MNRDEADRLEALLNILGEGRPAWQREAACRGVGVATFFPERGEDHLTALQMCQTCPVAEQCREYGLMERDGVWGGLTGRQRRRERRDRILTGDDSATTNEPRSILNAFGQEACINGHPWVVDRYLANDGRWRCRGCNREATAKRRESRRQAS